MTNFPLPLVLDAVAKASFILAVTALVAASLRRASASARHFVWALGLLSALAAPALSIALPRWEVPLVTIATPAAKTTDGTARPSSGDAQQRSQLLTVARADTTPASTAAVPPASGSV